MKNALILICVLSTQLLAQPPAEWCHGIVNVYHCGLPDEKIPFVIPVVHVMPTSPPNVYKTDNLLMSTNYMICLRDVCKSFDKETYDLISQLSLDLAKDMNHAGQRQRIIKVGDDAELAALGTKVDVGEFSMGHVCIPRQKYTFTINLRDHFTDLTFTCLNEFELSGPRIKTYKSGVLKPYFGGPTWTNIR